MPDLSNWKASDFAAWWGAVVATIGVGWTIYREVRSGPRVVVTASPNAMIFPETPFTKGKRFISVTAINRGTLPTTITNLVGSHAPSWWWHLRRMRKHFVVISGPPLSTPLPRVLQPGEQWTGFAEQTGAIAAGAFVHMGVRVSHRNAPVQVRVRFVLRSQAVRGLIEPSPPE